MVWEGVWGGHSSSFIHSFYLPLYLPPPHFFLHIFSLSLSFLFFFSCPSSSSPFCLFSPVIRGGRVASPGAMSYDIAHVTGRERSKCTILLPYDRLFIALLGFFGCLQAITLVSMLKTMFIFHGVESIHGNLGKEGKGGGGTHTVLFIKATQSNNLEEILEIRIFTSHAKESVRIV